MTIGDKCPYCGRELFSAICRARGGSGTAASLTAGTAQFGERLRGKFGRLRGGTRNEKKTARGDTPRAVFCVSIRR